METESQKYLNDILLERRKEKAWVTFHNPNTDDWENKWYPLNCPVTGKHLDFHEYDTMNLCRAVFSDRHFGIAPTSQKDIGNASRDNF
tara:strand:- start:1445 stop:1708 length:264 start_codon:yes stop_codon:yes gene_type:complete